MTSTHEGFGLTAAEAMASGCPVVATRAHGNEEFCIDGVTALVAAAGDVEQLARHCLRLQTDPAFARSWARTAGSFIRQLHLGPRRRSAGTGVPGTARAGDRHRGAQQCPNGGGVRRRR